MTTFNYNKSSDAQEGLSFIGDENQFTADFIYLQ